MGTEGESLGIQGWERAVGSVCGNLLRHIYTISGLKTEEECVIACWYMFF